MSRNELIIKMTESGELTRMYQAGMIGYKVLMYRDMYLDVQTQISLGNSKRQAVFNVADMYGVGIVTVYRALKFCR